MSESAVITAGESYSEDSYWAICDSFDSDSQDRRSKERQVTASELAAIESAPYEVTPQDNDARRKFILYTSIISARVALMGELLGEHADRVDGDDLVFRPVQEQARRRTGGEEREVVKARRRRHRDEAGDFGPAHEELHPDPGAEREAADPALRRVRVRVRGLSGHPVAVIDSIRDGMVKAGQPFKLLDLPPASTVGRAVWMHDDLAALTYAHDSLLDSNAESSHPLRGVSLSYVPRTMLQPSDEVESDKDHFDLNRIHKWLSKPISSSPAFDPDVDRNSKLTWAVNSYRLLTKGWDGQEGDPPSDKTVDEALSFIGLLTAGISLPKTFAAGDGEIGFYWKNGNGFIDVSFYGDGNIYYYARVDNKGIEVDGVESYTGRSIPKRLAEAISSI